MIVRVKIIRQGVKILILELLHKRWSVRKFLSKPIPDSVVQKILEAGRLSPSGGNEQPWRFGVITDPKLIHKIALLAYGQKWIETAPLLIILCTRVVSDERGGRSIQKARFPEWADKINQMDKDLYSKINMEEHQTKIAGTHMALAALEEGIGSTWVSYFHVEKVARLLDLPEGYIPAEILVFGHPAEEQKVRKKKELEEIVFYCIEKEEVR